MFFKFKSPESLFPIKRTECISTFPCSTFTSSCFKTLGTSISLCLFLFELEFEFELN